MKNAVPSPASNLAYPLDEGQIKHVVAEESRSVSPQKLMPGYFALTMATGIMATTTFRLGIHILDVIFLALAALSYVVLMGANVWRISSYFADVIQDFSDFGRGPGFFTAIAATNVLANALLIVASQRQLAWGLWVFSWVLWVPMIYGFGLSMITQKAKLGLAESINGSWLIIVVATQSISIAASNLASTSWDPASMLLLSTCMFILGSALYITIILLILYRLFFFVLRPETFTPTYWVCMGAAAISTLAGAELDKRSSLWISHLQAEPVLQGFTFFFWVVATGWIPMLLLLGLWRHIVRKVPFTYDPQYWSLVFPFGMYTLCTFTLASHFNLDVLKPIPPVSVWIAIFAWCSTGTGLLLHSVRQMKAVRLGAMTRT